MLGKARSSPGEGPPFPALHPAPGVGSSRLAPAAPAPVLVLVLALVLLASPWPLRAAVPGAGGPAPGERPRVGLVLGGGGARGAAHIGVLQVLEELGVPVDVVVGTSMGAVVGGLWASGVPASRIAGILDGIGWKEAFRDRVDRRQLVYRRKEDDAGFLVKARLGLGRKKALLPRGLVTGQRLELLLRRLTLPVATVEDFDRLPVAFRAVATDLETGQRVVMGDGDLVSAIRASLSVPGVFVPVERGGRLLVDGGLTDNLPVALAREMGVDVVIAVDVGDTLQGRRHLTSAVDVADQMVTLLLRQNTDRSRASLEPRDLLLVPDLGDRSSSDFARPSEIIPLGAAAARAAAGRLEELALPAAEYRRWWRARFARPWSPPEVVAVHLAGTGSAVAPTFDERLATQAGQRLDPTALDEDVERIYGLDLFEKVSYRISPAPGGVAVDLEARRRPWSRGYLRFGVALTDDFGGETSFDVGTRYVATRLNRRGGEGRVDLRLGERELFRGELYQPLVTRRPWFVALHLGYREERRQAVVGERRFADGRFKSLAGGADLGLALGRWGELRLGVAREQASVRERGRETDPALRFAQAQEELRLAFDTLDDRAFPTRGALGLVSFAESSGALGSEVRFRRLRVEARQAFSWGASTVVPAVEGAFDLVDSPAVSLFDLGGFLRLSGLGSRELVGSELLLGRLVYRRRTVLSGLAALPFYLGGSIEAGNVWDDRSRVDPGDLRIHGSLFVGADTPLGPVYLATGLGSGRGGTFFFSLGRSF